MTEIKAKAAGFAVRVRYFASLREQLDCAQEQVGLTAGDSLADLKAMLATARGQALLGPKVRCACNGVLCADDSLPLADGDEVAFFPPVTGG